MCVISTWLVTAQDPIVFYEDGLIFCLDHISSVDTIIMLFK
jgi:hypothetical protein